MHFDTEERFMATLGYPSYADHIEKRNVLRQKVREFREEGHQIHDATFLIRVSQFLTYWLIHHIKHEDLKMITFLRQARQKNQPSLASDCSDSAL